MILDAGPTKGGIESTVLDLTSSPPRLLRPGPITGEEIRSEIGEILTWSAPGEGEPIRSPGMSARHYAPNCTVEIAHGGGRERAINLTSSGLLIGWITFETGTPANDRVVQVTMPSEPVEYGRRIYAVLHELDDADVDRIIVDEVPEDAAWNAVGDRLRRAASVDNS